jgi:hypothetical protein
LGKLLVFLFCPILNKIKVIFNYKRQIKKYFLLFKKIYLILWLGLSKSDIAECHQQKVYYQKYRDMLNTKYR